MRRDFISLTVVLSLLGCGVPEGQHERVGATRPELDAANKRIMELEDEVARLSETDAAHWKQILDLKSKGYWLSVIRAVDEFLEEWPGSSYREQALKLRSEAVELQASDLLSRAQSEIQQQRFEQAKATLVGLTHNYPTSRARSEADRELRTLDAKIAAARRRQVGAGAWRTWTGISPIDDSTNVQISLASSETISEQFGAEAQPRLYVRCQEKKTEVFVVWDVYLGIDETDVLHRLDDNPARTLEWGISTDYKAAFYPGSDVAFARELQKHEKLLLRTTPYGEEPVTATFNLVGLENAIEPLKKACGWK